ncbi:hypothetical protein Tco_0748698 [Tanacetum coccineum]|uniref:Uncharacterized protein n=1 Tax=Tanacetum coccineum TaxID=301880 RepID=A0ABQ4YX55_9ASTR
MRGSGGGVEVEGAVEWAGAWGLVGVVGVRVDDDGGGGGVGRGAVGESSGGVSTVSGCGRESGVCEWGGAGVVGESGRARGSIAGEDVRGGRGLAKRGGGVGGGE